MSTWSTFVKAYLVVTLFASFAFASAAARRQTYIDLASDAYVWGYPAVLMQNTREAMIGRDGSNQPYLNHFFPLSEKSWPALETILPLNTENIYGWAWLDLSRQAYVLSLPEIKSKYRSVFIVDAYGNVVHVAKDKNLVLASSQWRGEAPQNMQLIRIPTSQAFALSQVFVRSPNDRPLLKEASGEIKLVSLEKWQKGFKDEANQSLSLPPFQKPDKNLASLGMDYLKSLQKILSRNPLNDEKDQKQWTRFEDLGLTDVSTLENLAQDPDARNLIDRGLYDGEREVEARLALGFGAKVNGWSYEMQGLEDKNDLLLKAALAKKSLFPIPAEESMQIRIDIDSEARQLNSAYKYVLHFNKIDLPAAGQAWSLKVRDHFQKNPQVSTPDHSALNNQNGALKYNEDGSLDIFVQRASPSKPEQSNWLAPSKNSNFYVLLTVYDPDESMIQRKYIAPSLTRRDENSLPRPKVVQTMMAQLQVSK